MELKIVCQCGQKYKFDVDPVNGRMPFTVNCPVCNQDGTFAANLRLAELLANSQPPSPPSPPAPAATSSAGGLRLSRASSPPSEPAAAAVGEADAAPPAPIRPLRAGAATVTRKPKQTPNFGMGMLGGFVGALVGVTIYFVVFKYTGLRIKLLAIGVGALAGWFADFLGKGEGSKELGGLTVVFVLGGLIGAQYLVALGWWNEFRETQIKEVAVLYDSSVTEAREAMKVVPTGSDAEIRAYLVKQAAKEGDKLDPGTIANDDVKIFRTVVLPEYQSLATGQISREQFEQSHHLKTHETAAEQQEETNTFKGIFMLLLLSKMNLFSLAAAGGLAFKMSTNA